MATVTFDSVGKTYTDGTHAVRALSLDIRDGEFLVMVGPSGCGKTTALRMCAGLESISSGELRIGGTLVNDIPPQSRDIAMVFQNYALYPHMTVFENIAFPLRSQKRPGSEVNERVGRAAKMLGLTEHLKRKPRNLSGGQRQRVAMGRAIVREPQVFLMDEPLSNLDAKLRVHMRAEIAETQRRLGATTLYVTHDQLEAMTMGHRIAVMRHGELQQIGEPQEVYDRPANLFVAEFLGAPAMTVFRGVVHSPADRGLSIQVKDQVLTIEGGLDREREAALRPYIGREVAVGVRPEHLWDAAGAEAGWPRLTGTVTLTENLGAQTLVHVVIDATPVVAPDAQAAGSTDLSDPEAEHTTAIAAFPPGSHTQVGAEQGLAIPPQNMHFFDIDTGRAIR